MVRKKVFLLNTHVSNIFNRQTDFMERLQNMIDLFRDNPAIVLWWRPHPLSLATIKSINPSMYIEYMELVKSLEHIPNIIYDDTEDMNRAIAETDAYIGDESSMIPLYVITGKPVLLNVFSERTVSYPLRFWAGVQVGDWLYFSVLEYNGFFRMNLLTKNYEYLGLFGMEKHAYKNLHIKAFRYGESIWFIPAYGEYIARVHLETLEMQYIRAADYCHIFGSGSVFNHAVQNGQFAFLIPGCSDGVLKLDMGTGDITIYNKWGNDLKLDFSNMNFLKGLIIDDQLILLPNNINRLVVLDLNSGIFHTYPWDYPDMAFSSFIYDGENVWFVPYKYDSIIKYSIANQSTVSIEIPPGAKEREIKFMDVAFFESRLWFLPWHAKNILILNPQNHQFEIRNQYGKEEYGGKRSDVITFVTGEESLYIVPGYSNKMLAVSDHGSRTAVYDITIPRDDYRKYLENSRRIQEEPMLETMLETSRTFAIEDFIDAVCKEDRTEKKEEADNQSETCGIKVWNMVRQRLQIG